MDSIRIRCPKCNWEPDGKPYWQCSCGHVWDTFSTGGRCPACQKVWEDTKCPGHVGGCDKWSPHLDWYENLDDIVDEIRQETVMPVNIPLSKAKLTKLLVFSVVFLAAGVWMVVTNPRVDNPVFDNVVVKIVAGYGAMIMGLFGIYFFARKLMDKGPGLIIDAQGIYNNTSAFRDGFIPWCEISGIYERSVQASLASKQHFVTIVKTGGSRIHISTNGLETNHNDLLKLMKSYYEKYKQPA